MGHVPYRLSCSSTLSDQLIFELLVVSGVESCEVQRQLIRSGSSSLALHSNPPQSQSALTEASAEHLISDLPDRDSYIRFTRRNGFSISNFESFNRPATSPLPLHHSLPPYIDAQSCHKRPHRNNKPSSITSKRNPISSVPKLSQLQPLKSRSIKH